MEERALLTLRGVHKSYGDFMAVHPLDLDVPRGVIYGVLGPNGAGKSTMIRMVMNILLPDGGTIELDGQHIDRRVLDRIGYLPEERGLYKKMKVVDHLVYLGRLKGLDKVEAERRSRAWLERLDLSDRAEAKVDEFSKGMQQKVQFVGTIMSEPEVVILDEPFSGLDPINVAQLKEIILELREKGTTVLFSTHVLEQAEKMCDHIFLMNRGHKILDGRLDAIRDSYPVDTITVEGRFGEAELSGLDGVDTVTPDGNEWRVKLREGYESQALLSGLMGRGRVDRFLAVRPSLSDIFLREVGHSVEEAAAEAAREQEEAALG